MRKLETFVLAGLAATILLGCSSQDMSADIPTDPIREVDAEVLGDMQDSWILKTKTKQLEVCSASSDGTNVDSNVVDVYTLGNPGIYGSIDQVMAAIEVVLLEECGGLSPLTDADGADAGAIAQAEWDRTVREIGSVDEVCVFWRGNNFDQGVMFGAAPAAMERAGYFPEDGKVLEIVVSYDMIIRENCQ